jgi:flagellar hook protein FlgE
MALTGALYTGVSGLSANQTWLNVIGNNVANSNTTSFKASTVQFMPEFYVTQQDASAPSSTFGGTNPSQTGLGTVVASISENFAPGAIQSTGQATDMAIDGSGFFVVKGATQSYTRDGAFTLNASNQLVTSGGDFVQGYGVDAAGNVQAGTLQNITVPLGASQVAKATTTATMQGNLDASGAVATGASILLSQDLTTIGGAAAPTTATALTSIASASASATPLFATGQTITLQGTKGGRTLSPSTFTVGATSTLQDLTTFLQQGMGIDTNVPPPTTTASPGAAIQNGTAANSIDLVLTGNTGTDNAIEISGTALTSSSGTSPLSFADGTDAAGFTSNPNGESVHTSFQAYDSLGTPVTVDVTAVLESTASSGNTWRFYADSGQNTAGGLAVGNGTLTFDNSGNLKSSTGTTVTIDRGGTGATTPLAMTLNFGQMTQLTGQQSTMVESNQDGFPAGTLNSFSVGTDGVITGAFTNGQTRTLGQVAMATFANDNGLTDSGSNMYTASAASGTPQIGAPGQFGAGQIRGASLEQSNVDLSTEFTNMIIASTGFSASSKVITTSDQLIQELLNTANH